MSLYLEDITVGARYQTPSHQITLADIAGFCQLTRDHHPLHTDREAAQKAGFSDVIAHGLYGLALMEGLKTELHLFDDSSIASLGWDKVRFVQPMLAGDVVFVEMEFTAIRESRGRGILTEAVWLKRQDGTLLISAEHVGMIKKRG